jgi:hypothetical protein
VAQDGQGRVRKQLHLAKEISRKNWHSDSLKRFNLLFLRVKRRREMKLMMKMMMMF